MFLRKLFSIIFLYILGYLENNSDEPYQSIYPCEFYSVHIYKDNLQIIKSLSESYRKHENLIIVPYIHCFLIDKLANFSTKKMKIILKFKFRFMDLYSTFKRSLFGLSNCRILYVHFCSCIH